MGAARGDNSGERTAVDGDNGGQPECVEDTVMTGGTQELMVEIHFNGFDLITNLRDQGPGRAPNRQTHRTSKGALKNKHGVRNLKPCVSLEGQILLSSTLASEARLIFLG
ncbi:hypothetical protein LWI29_018942 [Acer saccharum]|uniref:Uncharacterized protein n=1 Tax=Acer saccharum TaxID=4024 RepID=A0AA39SUB2_ACESA|nr:hypothetical protein LWI29_018942 [Acer saccharum]